MMEISKVNGKQSKEARIIKERFVRVCGFESKVARVLRDWSLGHIIQYLSARKLKQDYSYPNKKNV